MKLDDITDDELIQKVARYLEEKYGILASAEFEHMSVMYMVTGDKLPCHTKRPHVAEAWETTKRLLGRGAKRYRSKSEKRLADFWALITWSPSLGDERYVESVRRLDGELAEGTVDMGVFRWLWDGYEGEFGSECYDSQLSSSPFWESYGDFVRLVCDEISHVDETDEQLSAIVGPQEIESDRLYGFDSRVRTCIESARRYGKHFEFNEMAGLYSLLRRCDRNKDSKTHHRVYCAMYSEEAAGPFIDLSWLDEWAKEDESGSSSAR